MDVRAAAQHLNLSTASIRRLIATGLLTATAIGKGNRKTWDIDAASVEWLAAQRQANPPKRGRKRKQESSDGNSNNQNS